MSVIPFKKRGKKASQPGMNLLSFIDAFASFSPAGEAERRMREENEAARLGARKDRGKPVHGAA